MRNIGEYLRRYRKWKGWTQDGMAKELGMSAVSYWKIEKGYTDVNIKKLEQIAEVLQLTIPDILFEAETGYQSFSIFESEERQKIITLQDQLIEKEKELKWLKEKVTDLLEQLGSFNTQ